MQLHFHLAPKEGVQVLRNFTAALYLAHYIKFLSCVDKN